MRNSLEIRRDIAMAVQQLRTMLDDPERYDRQGGRWISQEHENAYRRVEQDVERLEQQLEEAERIEAREQRYAPVGLPLEPPGAQRAVVEDLVELRTPAGSSDGRHGRVLSFKPDSAARGNLRGFILGDHGKSGTYEFRALQAESDVAGGYTINPQEFVARLIQAVDDMLFMRQFGTVVTVATAESIGYPVLDADPSDADWTSELSIGGEESTMGFAKREMHPHPLAKLLKVSEKLLRSSALDVEALVRERMAYKFGVTLEKAYLSGSGAGQPLGLFTASAQGINTDRDVSTGNSTTAIGADNLYETFYAVKSQYQSRGRWLLSRTAIKQIRKLKDGNGNYLWQPGLAGGQPATILERPYLVSEYVPSTFTSGLYVGLFGDLSQYWIADALSFRLQRLVELYAGTNQVGFIGRFETDGAPVLAEAFARMTLA